MEPVWRALELILEPSSIALISTAVLVVYLSAERALKHERESSQRNTSNHQSSSMITLSSSHALTIPLASSTLLLLMFYLYASLSLFITLLTSLVAISSLVFCMAPYTSGLHKLVLPLLTTSILLLWLVSGHWLINNLLGISTCIAFVSHVRLPNFRVCTLLLCCLFLYDIFWVFCSESFFGDNVMVAVATRQASNPVRTVADKLRLPAVDWIIAKKLDMPVKIVYPRQLLGGAGVPSVHGLDYMMLGLGDMAIPGMLLALVHCFDHRKLRVSEPRYLSLALAGYGVGLVFALAIGLVFRSAQPALLYLVPSTLGPVMFAAWKRGEFSELWSGPRPIFNDKTQLDAV